MLKIKYTLLLILLSASFLNAQELRTSNETVNLEVMTDLECDTTHTNSQAHEDMPEPQTQEVETVNYTLTGYKEVASFPVTIRSNKKHGE